MIVFINWLGSGASRSLSGSESYALCCESTSGSAEGNQYTASRSGWNVVRSCSGTDTSETGYRSNSHLW